MPGQPQSQQPLSPTYTSDPYAATPQGGYASTHATSYYSAAATPGQQPVPERSYTLGGDGYGSNSVPPLDNNGGGYFASPGPITSNLPATGPPKAPQFEDSPPGYDAGASGVQGAWGKH